MKLGEQAYKEGKPIEANPYRETFWGFGGHWAWGWYQAKLDAQYAHKGIEVQP